MHQNDESEIIVTIPEEGSITIQVVNVKGEGCKDLTAPLERKLGVKISDTPTKEMYEEARIGERTNNRY